MDRDPPRDRHALVKTAPGPGRRVVGGRASACAYRVCAQHSPVMLRPLILAALLAGSTAPALAQEFPAPGTGLLSFEPVGDRPLKISSFAFTTDGLLFVAATGDTLYSLEVGPGAGPAGRWTPIRGPRNAYDALATVGTGGDTLLVGRTFVLFRSIDGGTTWSVVNGDPIETSQGLAGPSEPDAFAALPPGHASAGRLLSGGGILYSDDRGASWAQATRSFPGEQGNAYAFATLPSGRVLMAGSWGVAASDDGGASYAVTPLWGDYAVETHTITALATLGSSQAGAPACGLADGTLCDGAVVAGISVTAPDMQVWRTNDGGRTWAEPVSLPEPYDGVGAGYPASVVALPPGSDGLARALIVGRRGVVFRTLDGGASWEAVARLPIRPGPPSHRAELARVGPDGHLWVATFLNGPEREWLYRSVEPADAAFIVADEATPPPSGLRLDIRPNPSGASAPASVAVTLAAPATSAMVAVYDALGRLVATLHSGPLSNGTHTFSAGAAPLAPGVYTVRAEAGADRLARTFSVAR